MKNKKAQGLPMNAIVIAAIVLVVMIVLILIFTGGIGKWGENRDATQVTALARAECLGKMGTVKEGSSCDAGYDQKEIEDLGAGFVCCVKRPLTQEEKCDKAGGKWQAACDDQHIESALILPKEGKKCCMPKGVND